MCSSELFVMHRGARRGSARGSRRGCAPGVRVVGHMRQQAPEASSASDSVASDPHWVDGRHPIVASEQEDLANVLVRDFLTLSSDVLTSIGVGVGQRVVASLTPSPVTSHKEPIPATRADHVAVVRSQFTAYAFKLESISACITQLLALEHVMSERLNIMEDNLERHEASEDVVCLDCEFTLEAHDRVMSLANCFAF